MVCAGGDEFDGGTRGAWGYARRMGNHRDLKLLELVDQIVAEVTLLATEGSTRLLFKNQLLNSVESVSANIGEAFGRGTKPDRNRALFVGFAERLRRQFAT